MARWVAICQQCWYDEFPGEYLPDGIEFETCGVCGQDDLCAHVSPKQLSVVIDDDIHTED